MPHAVLVGDSIFDNGPYVGPGEAVVDALTPLLPAGWDVTLNARDGSVTSEVAAQMTRRPAGASHLLISCGGNDALGHLGLLQASCGSVHQALAMLAQPVAAFRSDYRAMLTLARSTGLQLTVCTVYDAVPGLDAATRLALTLFNDVILREAWAQKIDVLDLRAIATDAADYAAVSPIEPSAIGARKIAAALAALLRAPADAMAARVFAG